MAFLKASLFYVLRHPEAGSVRELVSCCGGFLPVGSNGELCGSRSDWFGTPVLGAGPAGVGGRERSGGGSVGAGEVGPEHQEREFCARMLMRWVRPADRL